MSALRADFSPAGLRYDEPMSRHTSWRVGGPADIYFKPESLADLREFLAALDSDTPVHWVGLGSNLLVRDAGIRGAVVNTLRLFNNIDPVDDLTIVAGAGVPCTRLARQAQRLGMGPADFFAGIPGTVGGALSMNAGAFGGETWERVASVRVINRKGELFERGPEDYVIAYRSVMGPADEWFCEASFQFIEGFPVDPVKAEEMLARRKQTQPLGLPSCGSVFRNPPNDHSARLIEAAGLKGHRIGDAEVSEKHANFIINRGDASAGDIEDLITHVQATVERVHGIRLRHEVRILGERQ